MLVALDAEERRADIEAAVAESRRATAQRNEIATRSARRPCADPGPEPRRRWTT